MKPKFKEKDSARKVAYTIIFQFEKSLDRLDGLFQTLLHTSKLSAEDHRFVVNLVSGTVRNLRLLDYVAEQMYKGKYKKLLNKTKVILKLAFYEILFLEHIPERATVHEYVGMAKKKAGLNQSKLINAMLRNYLKAPLNISLNSIDGPIEQRLSIYYSFPVWLVKRWLKYWGEEETGLILESLNTVPRFDIRLNPQLITHSDMKEKLNGQGIDHEQSHLFTNMFTITDTQKLIKSGLLQNGCCSVQDESAHYPVEAMDIKKGERVLDVCAAPGGKYSQILEQGKAKLAVAVDSDGKRLKRVKENVKRLKLAGGKYVCADARHLPFKAGFNKILLDAPCSGLGVIRKHPDIKWRRTPDEIVQFSELQQQILDSTAGSIVEGGSIYYSTCTLDYLENEAVVNRFLEKKAGEFALREIVLHPELGKDRPGNFYRFFPHKHSTDGSFLAVIKKTK